MRLDILFKEGVWKKNATDLAFYLDYSEITKLSKSFEINLNKNLSAWVIDDLGEEEIINQISFKLGKNYRGVLLFQNGCIRLEIYQNGYRIELAFFLEQIKICQFINFIDGKTGALSKKEIFNYLQPSIKSYINHLDKNLLAEPDLSIWLENRRIISQDLEMILRPRLEQIGINLESTNIDVDYDQLQENDWSIKVEGKSNCLLETNDDNQFIGEPVDLRQEYLFIGRVTRIGLIKKEIEKKYPECIIRANYLCLPKQSRSTHVHPTAFIYQHKKYTQIYYGWITQNGEETVRVETIKLQLGSPIQLLGFEKIIFDGSPKKTYIFIPKLDEKLELEKKHLVLLEKNNEWIYLARYWKLKKDYLKAKICFNRSKSYHHNLDKHKLFKEFHSINKSTYTNSQINSPIRKDISINISFANGPFGKFLQVDQESKLTISVLNKSKNIPIERIVIHWYCDITGDHTFRFHKLDPGEREERPLKKTVIPRRSGLFPVKMDITIKVSKGEIIELKRADDLRVLPTKQTINIRGDAGLIKIETNDPDFIPEINADQDVGAVIYRINTDENS